MQPPTRETPSSETDLMIQAKGLSKTFTTKRRMVNAVTDLDLQVRTGELVAFLGPNGAGKSTTMKVLTGYLPATSGAAFICGIDVARDPLDAKRRIGYLPEGSPL